MENGKALEPFLKWAGGKRWLASGYSGFLSHTFKRYIEPFLGSGAVFFSLAPAKAILSDRNEELIQTYQAIKDDWKSVERALKGHHSRHSKKYYYEIRDSRPRVAHTKAARFIYLNRTCWNGLYRVNLNGEFNVPIGTKTNVTLDSDNFQSIARLLRNAVLTAKDFEPVIDIAREGDLVFVDPPYTVKHNLNGFLKYNEVLFSWADQIRLRDSILRAKKRGATIVVTNAYHSSVRSLYENVGNHHRLQRPSLLAANSKHRRRCDELLVMVG